LLLSIPNDLCNFIQLERYNEFERITHRMNFQNKVAIVTGAGEGIGFEIAKQLSQQGAKIILNDIHEALAKKAAQSIGNSCLGVGGDIAQIETVQGLVTRAVETFGRLDMVVANARLTVWGDFFSYTSEDFERVVSVNLRGSFFLAQAIAKQMQKQKLGGRMVFMSSVTGHQAVPFLAAYSMTKAGLEMLARNLVLELSPYGITINCVAPGAVVTPRNLIDDPNYETTWGNLLPTGKAIQTHDIANAVLFLLSPASRQITGQTIVVDGGWSVTSPVPGFEFVKVRN
jgi:glucose 1-dehydrogenase